MKYAWISAVAAAACGALVAWFVAARSTDVRPAHDELSEAVTALEEATSVLRSTIAARPALGHPSPVSVSGSAPARGPDGPVPDVSTPGPRSSPSPGPHRVAGRAMLPPPDREGVAALTAWRTEMRHDDEGVAAREKGVRRRWLFATEEEVLAAFGAPDEVYGHAGEEHWNYWQYDGREQTTSVDLVFWNGRLRQVN